MVFNYWSVYTLLVFLLKRNPALRRRWPRCKLHLVRSMEKNVILWKLRGVLLAATKEDIDHANRNGLFWNRDLLDSVTRVLRGRKLDQSPLFTSIIHRRDKIYAALERWEQDHKDYQGRPDYDRLHEDDAAAMDEGYIEIPPANAFIQLGDNIGGQHENHEDYVATIAAAAARNNNEFAQSDDATPGSSNAAGWIRTRAHSPGQDRFFELRGIQVPLLREDVPALQPAAQDVARPNARRALEEEEDAGEWIRIQRPRVGDREITPAELFIEVDDHDDDQSTNYDSVEEARQANEAARVAMLADSDSEVDFDSEEEVAAIPQVVEAVVHEAPVMAARGEIAVRGAAAAAALQEFEETLSLDSGYNSACSEDLAARERVAELLNYESSGSVEY